MIDLTNIKKIIGDKKVAVFGLGKSGISTARALCAVDINTNVWDDNDLARDAAKDMDFNVLNLHGVNWGDYAFLVLAPGIMKSNPIPSAAIEAGCEVICDMELLHRINHTRKVVGITGTNGKSTTTALTAHILKTAEVEASVGGNIGTPVMDLTMPSESGVFVFEISSFQADLCPSFTPDITAILNLEPDHIEHHGDMKSYVDAKAKMLRGSGIAIFGIDDIHTQELSEKTIKDGNRDVVLVSTKTEIEGGFYVTSNADIINDCGDKIANIKKAQAIKGVHNWENACICAAICSKGLGVSNSHIEESLNNWEGLPHRQFLIRSIDGVGYVNDSKATNLAAAARGLASFSPIYWIVGGKRRACDLDTISSLLNSVRHAFLIGQSADELQKFFSKHGVEFTDCKNLDNALSEAHKMAQNERGRPGGAGVVLLSPAYQSFDQFKSFEDRGEQFTKLVDELTEI